MNRLMLLAALVSTPLLAQAPASPPAPAPAAASVPAPAGSMTLDQFLSRQSARILAADSDGDGRVSKAEMAGMARGGRDPSRLFDRMDLNHDGYLDASEIKAVLTRRFQRMDANGDGIVSADERMAGREGLRGRAAAGARGGEPTPQ